LNASDDDAKNYIRIFTLLPKEEIEHLEAGHIVSPHLRLLQKTLAKEITIRVHSEEDYNAAVEASQILFNGSIEDLAKLSEELFLDIFDGVPQFEISKSDINAGVSIVDLLAEKTSVFPSKGEARKMIQGGGVAINKNKIEELELKVGESYLINKKYILIQKGKKNYFVMKAV
jgi:tyrosyl-tRNA synthetase